MHVTIFQVEFTDGRRVALTVDLRWVPAYVAAVCLAAWLMH